MRRILSIAVLAAALSACGNQQEQAAPPPPEVEVLTVQPGAQPLRQDLVGRLAPFRSADVRARVPGVLERRVYTEGSDVKEGDVLFVIDPAQLQAALGNAQAAEAQAQAQYTNAKTAADRARQLAPTDFISKSDLDNALATERSAQASLEAARASVRSAQINLGYATVRAPISGRAGKQQVTEGALVGQGDVTLLTTVDQIDPLYVNFSMSVSDMQALRAKQVDRNDQASVQVRLQDGTIYEHTGTLDFSADVVDPATGAIALRATVPNPDRRLLPGTYVTLVADMGRQDGIYVVPQAAVQRDATSAFVLVAGPDDKVVRKDINVVRADGGNWIVDAGLSAGDRVITVGLQRAQVGAPVSPKPAEAAAAKPDNAATPPAGAQAPAPAAPPAADAPAADAADQD
ncbi:efflux RND transporter periplasmic adaptor subunit [Luteimonas sp. gir]|uniref:efflux RND transporter periplasmic adaptor subunit n=1 Tax=Luteimonas sp. gir TaxID=3127960 RepID=UPI003075CA89